MRFARWQSEGQSETGDWPKATQESSGKNSVTTATSSTMELGTSESVLGSQHTHFVCLPSLSQPNCPHLNALPGQSPFYSAPPSSYLLSNSSISPIFLRSERFPQRLFLGHTTVECLLPQGEEEPAKVLTALSAMEV